MTTREQLKEDIKRQRELRRQFYVYLGLQLEQQWELLRKAQAYLHQHRDDGAPQIDIFMHDACRWWLSGQNTQRRIDQLMPQWKEAKSRLHESDLPDR